MRKALLILLFAFGLVLSTALAATAESESSANAHFMRWSERSDVVHILAFEDDGRPGRPVAVVHGKAPIRFGYEYGNESVEDLQSAVIDNADHDIEMAIDDGPWVSVKSGYQAPFVAVPGAGPRWSWDHDGDGLGDGNGNGIADWEGPILFWRWSVTHLEKGTHTFHFRLTEDGGSNFFTDTINAEFG